ncbi:MAG: hypothetical protein ACJAW1_002799 [Glaciecola sp.]|jgi:hypothetical protein
MQSNTRAHSDGFRYTPTYLMLSEINEINDFLTISQLNTKKISRHCYRSIHNGCERIQKVATSYDKSPTTQLALVLKRASSDKLSNGNGSGYWTNLIFVSGDKKQSITSWIVTGYARSRLSSIFLNAQQDDSDKFQHGSDISFVEHTKVS